MPSTSGRVVRRIPCNHTPRSSDLPSGRTRIRACRDKTRNTLMIDPPKATKGRRMSKKTRKKSSKASPPKSGRTSPQSASAAKTVRAKAHGKKPAQGGNEAGKATAKTAAKTCAQGRSKPLKSAERRKGHIETVESKHRAPRPSRCSSRRPSPSRRPQPADRSPVEGAKAPAFQLPRDGGDSVSLADYAGKKLVLFFYPRADTPGCTREAIDFTRLASAFADERNRGARRLRRHRQGAGIIPRQASAFRSSHLG